MNPIFLIFSFVMPIVLTFGMIKKYRLSKSRIAILFFLAPLLNVLFVEFYVLLTGQGESIGSAFFMGITLLYIWLFIPLLTTSTLMVYIQKTYTPTLLKQLLIVSLMSVSIMGIYLFMIHQAVFPALFAPLIATSSVSILYYLTNVAKVIK